MNILMALSQLEVTGAEVYATEIGKKLVNKKHNLFYVSDTLTKEHHGAYFPISFNKRNIFQRVAQVIKLVKIIHHNKIQVVHAHSRASAWSCEIACKITKTPFITTIHGMQHTSKYKKRRQPIGLGFSVCENIREDLINTFGVNSNNLKLLRNGIDLKDFNLTTPPNNEKKIISIIGRLSGPKAEITYNLLLKSIDFNKYNVNIIGGKIIPEKFFQFKPYVNFTGYVNNVYEYIKNSDLVIGAGRVAMESLLLGRPTLAIGEAFEIGLITNENISLALKSNFGDIGTRDTHCFNWEFIKEEIDKGVYINQTSNFVIELIKKEFNIETVVDILEKAYQQEFVRINKYDIPIIMYHRVIKDIDSEAGKHGTYVTVKQFRDHMKILKKGNFVPITFNDLKNISLHERFNKKYIILTFDDGYIDNYTYAFPILKEFNFKFVIYLVSNLDYNKWDVDLTNEKVFKMMDEKMLNEMKNSKLVEFGGHTLTHPRLSKLSPEEVEKEIILDKKFTEDKLDIKLCSFAYPYGDLNECVKGIVQKAGYSFAVATDSGSYSLSDDLYQIRRIGIFPNISNFGYKRKVSGYYNFIKIKRERRTC